MIKHDSSLRRGATLKEQGYFSNVVLAKIDQYELISELVGGGFGIVYLAEDTASGVQVAVKGLPPLEKNNREELENIRENFALVKYLVTTALASCLLCCRRRMVRC